MSSATAPLSGGNKFVFVGLFWCTISIVQVYRTRILRLLWLRVIFLMEITTFYWNICIHNMPKYILIMLKYQTPRIIKSISRFPSLIRELLAEFMILLEGLLISVKSSKHCQTANACHIYYHWLSTRDIEYLWLM